MTPYETEIAQWRADRLAALTAEDGWLDLTDRIDIAPGRMTVGKAADNDVAISAGPGHLGVLTLQPDGRARFDAGAGARDFAPVPDNPPRLKVGDLLLEVMEVGGQHALRVRDTASPARTAFSGIDSFPVDPAWRIEADWQALDQAQPLGIDLVTGAATSVQLTHQAHFTHEEARVTLLPTHWKSGKPMFVIRDRTSGRETYGASRFLIGEVVGDRVVLDFNKAFNPPCAFTDLAVCPLPPPQNVMAFAIRAGERKPRAPEPGAGAFDPPA
ncbi:hypothetical protein SAMN04488021_14920 [Paracoccus aminovorans]|uniref:DUF1684 domain-containing protein n=1 Tax=Paracoccus aminovorans TaxID=34004 RepID=A0A1I3EIY0_9RHOB|nr:DUF1684 domain-containing protein [Paracoccus aminovorans]CQR84353.1 hypothetical protein JCM7685_pAMV3p0408 [Paracoccus aminovorans]SFH98897.1 hypothetical protein SAMN04488021_14920 [Paracoccus aminovorans]